MIAIISGIVLTLFFRKYLAHGLTFGAEKGWGHLGEVEWGGRTGRGFICRLW